MNPIATTAAILFLLSAAPPIASVQAMSKKAPATQPVQTMPDTEKTTDTVWVGKSDEAKSCAKEKGIEIDSMGAALQNLGIKIITKKKLRDGKMRIQMCGVDKGDMNGYLIAKKDLEKAKSLGFSLVGN